MPRLDVIGVIVSDMDKAIAFYERLGLQFPEDPDPEGHGHVETTLPGGLRFTLDAEESTFNTGAFRFPRSSFRMESRPTVAADATTDNAPARGWGTAGSWPPRRAMKSLT